MQRFTIGQRVTLIGSPLNGKAGTIKELHADGDCAWAEMDATIPAYLVAHDTDARRRDWLLVHPSECEPVAGPPAPLPARDLSPGQLLVSRDG